MPHYERIVIDKIDSRVMKSPETTIKATNCRTSDKMPLFSIEALGRV